MSDIVDRLNERCWPLDRRDELCMDAVYVITDLRSRLAEIVAYCAQEGCDGEPYDTINAIARGEYSTRGGGR